MSELVYFMEAGRSRKVEAEVKERVQSGVCVCGCGRDVGKHKKLGLCRTCYYRYREVLRGLTKRQAAEYNSKLIREGVLLQPQEIRKIQSETVFEKAAKAVS